jgi:hypothetical protein
MKMSQKLRSQSAGPIWGLIFGLFFTGIGIGLLFYATYVHAASAFDEIVASCALLIGLLSAIYAARELRHTHR